MILFKTPVCSSNTNSYICLCIKYFSVLERSFHSSIIMQTHNLIKIWSCYAEIRTSETVTVLTVALASLGFIYIVADSLSGWGIQPPLQMKPPKSEQALGVVLALRILFQHEHFNIISFCSFYLAGLQEEWGSHLANEIFPNGKREGTRNLLSETALHCLSD